MLVHNPFAILRYWCLYLDSLGDILVRGDRQRDERGHVPVFSRNFGIVRPN